MDFYIFRHSETYFSKNKIPYGKDFEAAEIIPEGIPATQKLAKYLSTQKIDVFYTSPLKRCVQTAQIIQKKLKKGFTKDTRISEEMIDYGKETFEDVVERVKDFLDDIKSKKYSKVAICTHGWIISTLIALITKGKVEPKDLKEFPNCGVLIQIVNGKVTRKDFN